MNVKWKYRLSGAAAGLVSGLFGRRRRHGAGAAADSLVQDGPETGHGQLRGRNFAPVCPVRRYLSAALRIAPADSPSISNGRPGGRALGRQAVSQGARALAAADFRRILGIRRGAIPAVREYVLPALAGFFTGILSAWGIGGGTLLLLVMSLFLGVDQITAQGHQPAVLPPHSGYGSGAAPEKRAAGCAGLGRRYPLGAAGGGAGGALGYSGGCGGAKKALWGVSFGCRALHCFQQDSQGRLDAGKP